LINILYLKEKKWLFTLSFFKWIHLLWQRNLIDEIWCGQLIGDVVYDQYLASCRRGTVYYSVIRLAKIIYCIVREVEKAKLELKKTSPSASITITQSRVEYGDVHYAAMD
jgi:hypothetical protein